MKPGPSFGDTGTGMLMAISILAALRNRDRTGKGQRLQVAMHDAMIYYMRVPFSRTQLSGQAQLRGGSDRSQPGGLVPSALYPCKPGGPNDYVYVFTSRANPEHWTRPLRAIGREDLVGDPRYDTNQARSARAAEVHEIIAQWTRQHSKEEAMKIIGEAGVPAGAVFDTLELICSASRTRPIARRDIDLVDLVPIAIRSVEDCAMEPFFGDPGNRERVFLGAAAECDGDRVTDRDLRRQVDVMISIAGVGNEPVAAFG